MLVAKERENEPRESLEEVRELLVAIGKLLEGKIYVPPLRHPRFRPPGNGRRL